MKQISFEDTKELLSPRLENFISHNKNISFFKLDISSEDKDKYRDMPREFGISVGDTWIIIATTETDARFKVVLHLALL